MKVVIRSCAECPWLYYRLGGLLTCTFGANLTKRKPDDPRFPIDCPMTDNKCVIEIDPIPTCGTCGWRLNNACMLYGGTLTIKNGKAHRVSVCIDNEKSSR